MFLLIVCASFASVGSAQDIIISEFMTANQETLADEDLYYYPDWIELFNIGDTDADLEGWYLTDTKDNLTKWRFPSVELKSGQFLMVFASGKNRSEAGSELHTNFQLDPNGEYLALVNPNEEIVYEFAPFYPPQETDISYGIEMMSKHTLIERGSSALIFVPSDNSINDTWMQTDFEPIDWTEGPLPVGFDRKTSSTSYDDIINTDIEEQLWSVNTSVYIRIPFEVDDPAVFNFLKFIIHYDDGCVIFLNGEKIKTFNAPVNPQWDATANSTDSETEEFLLSNPAGTLQAGTNVLAIHGVNTSVSNIDLLLDIEMQGMSLLAIDESRLSYFSEPTPGENNSSGAPSIADHPQPSRPPGGYRDPFTLTFQTDASNAEIRYTTDGKEPTETSDLYTDPITVNSTMRIRTRVYEPDCLPSPVKTFCYMILDNTAADFSSNLPIIVVNSFGRNFNENTYTQAHMFVYDNKDSRNSLTDFAPFNSNAGLKYRGSSSLGFAKKMFSLEVWNEKNLEHMINLLGLPTPEDPAESDWVLYAPYSDKSLMRNVLSYEWSNAIGRYAPRTKFFELFLNTYSSGQLRYTTNYWGVYVLTEKIKRGPDRVDIEPLYASQNSEPEISGGYILKNDRLDPGDAGFTTSRGISLCYVVPKERQYPPSRPPQKIVTAQQKNWIRNYLNQFESALYGGNFSDPVNGYAQYIDPLSFIDHHLLVELTKNIDGYRLSTFMFKDRGKRLEMGPIWDYNLSLGNANYNNGWLSNGWYYAIGLSNDQYPWYPRLFQDSNFTQQYKERWFELRNGPLKTENLLASVDRHAARIEESQARNFRKWPLSSYVWPNWHIPSTWHDEIQWMKGWIEDRVLWMDSQFIVAPAFSSNGGEVDPGFTLTITSSMGEIRYTIDGRDPADSGVASLPYTGPIVINENTLVKARVQAGGSWGPMKEATFVTEMPQLVVTEIMYNPAVPDDSPYTSREFEFIELQNRGDKTITLRNASFVRGVDFIFPEGAYTKLEPGAFVVVVRNLNAFASLYDTASIPIAGEWDGLLSDRGENIELEGSAGEEILDFSYRDSWYPETDGGGYSLVIVDPYAPLDTWGDASSWRRSTDRYGSPGRADPTPAEGWQIQGDFNQDGHISLADPLGLLFYIAGDENRTLPCDKDGGNIMLLDLNMDARISIPDVIALLSYLFQNGKPPYLGNDCLKIDSCPDVCTPR